MTPLHIYTAVAGMMTSFGVSVATSVAMSAITVSRGAGPGLSMWCVVDDTLSVTAFIILYGLLFVPRNVFGRYWSSNDGVYSTVGDASGAVVGAAVGARLSTVS